MEVGDLSHSPVYVTVDGETFWVDVEGLDPESTVTSQRRRTRSPDIAVPSTPSPSLQAVPSDNILRSPMPGRVISILVRPGDQVSAEDEVCVVEAMKMEQSIRATRDGIIKAVFVQPMDSITPNDPLVELE